MTPRDFLDAMIQQKNSKCLWHKWFAWHPVQTINHERVWLRVIYRRKYYTKWFGEEHIWRYGTMFDIMKEL